MLRYVKSRPFYRSLRFIRFAVRFVGLIRRDYIDWMRQDAAARYQDGVIAIRATESRQRASIAFLLKYVRLIECNRVKTAVDEAALFARTLRTMPCIEDDVMRVPSLSADVLLIPV